MPIAANRKQYTIATEMLYLNYIYKPKQFYTLTSQNYVYVTSMSVLCSRLKKNSKDNIRTCPKVLDPVMLKITKSKHNMISKVQCSTVSEHLTASEMSQTCLLVELSS